MSRRYLTEFILLAAIWGASFLFMRVAAPSFGPLPLMLLRCGIGAAVLWPFLLWARPDGQARQTGPLTASAPAARWPVWRLLFTGLMNSALPFVLFGFAALSLTAGLSSILNATTPIFGAIVGFLWVGERLTPTRVAGLAIGIAGVVVLSWEAASFRAGGSGWAIIGALVATACYGVAGHFVRRRLADVPPLRVAVGSQTAAALLLLVPGVATWPEHAPSALAWGNAIALGALSSGIAYLLFYRLIARVGTAATLSVTYLIPVFGVLWGGLFLGERIDLPMVVGGFIVMLGTALATGVLKPR